jgi:hypothetical protein
METLKLILDHCQQLECLEVWCANEYLDESNLLEVVSKHSPEKFHELKIYWGFPFFRPNRESFSKDLEPILMSWVNRIPQKSLSLIIVGNLKVRKESMDVIERFKKLGVLKFAYV